VDSFIAVRRTADIIEESIEQASLTYIDRPITTALIDMLLDSCNEFIRALVGRGAIIDGSAYYVSSLNPASQLAAGQLVVSYKFMPPAPLERLTYEATLDVTLYSSVTATTSTTVG
jgi:phage tail sheath protein FI